MMRRGPFNVRFQANIVWNYKSSFKDWKCDRNSVHAGARSFAQPKHVAEYWQFDDEKVVSKFLSLKDFEQGIPDVDLKLGAAHGSSKIHWYLFRNINPITTEVLRLFFGLDAAWQRSLRAPAKVEYVRSATDQAGDHLLISLHDYRIQESGDDDTTGYVDDLSWISEIYENETSEETNYRQAVHAPHDELDMPERPSLITQQMVSKEVRFYYFPATNTVITIGTDAASMVRTGRAAILNNRSQVLGLWRGLCACSEHTLYTAFFLFCAHPIRLFISPQSAPSSLSLSLRHRG